MSKYLKKEHYQGWWNREIVLYKGDNVIAQGTIREIAEQRKVRYSTVYWLTMPTAHRRADKLKNGLRAIVV